MSMLSGSGTNDLAALKRWFDSGLSGIEDVTRSVSYSYGISPQVYLKEDDGYRQVNPDQTMSALGLSMEEMSTRGNAWKNEVRISNMCTVFAESEVVSLVAKNTDIADIIHGLNVSVAEKTVSLIRRGKGEPAYVMTGGVSKNPGVVSCLEEKLGCPVKVSEYSQLCGAIGAALIGLTGGR